MISTNCGKNRFSIDKYIRFYDQGNLLLNGITDVYVKLGDTIKNYIN